MDHFERPPARFVVGARGRGILFEGYGLGGPGVCLGDGQTGPMEYRHKVDAAMRCSGVPPYLT